MAFEVVEVGRGVGAVRAAVGLVGIVSVDVTGQVVGVVGEERAEGTAVEFGAATRVGRSRRTSRRGVRLWRTATTNLKTEGI